MTRPSDVIDTAVSIAELLGGGRDVPPVLAIRVPGEGRLAVVGRDMSPRRPGGPMDGLALAELMVLVAALRPEACALLTPGRRRDMTTDTILDRHLLVVGIDVTDGGNRMDAMAVPYEQHDGRMTSAPAMPLPVAATPLSSLVFDATVRTRLDLPASTVVAVLDGLGHRLLLDLPSGLPEGHPLMASATPDLTMDQVRGRVRRLADELHRRHAPTASAKKRQTAPGVPHNVPTGWLPACPI